MLNKRYIIAIDLDGTLLNDKKKISFRTLHYLRHLQKIGHTIVIASGRPFRSIEKYYKKLKLRSPVICYNGALMYNPNDESFLVTKFMLDKNKVRKLFKAIVPHYADNVKCESNTDMYMYKMDNDISRFFKFDGMKMHIGPFGDTLDEDVWTMIFTKRDSNSDKYIQEQVNAVDGVQVRFWGVSKFFEIFPVGESKGKRLLELANMLNIPKERVIAFGDAENDVEMLSSVGMGICMSNGYPAAKEAAKIITKKDNNHNGIVHCLKEIL